MSSIGNLKISKGKICDIDKILETNPTPLEDSLKEFQNKINNNSYLSNINLCLKVNKVLDQLESSLGYKK